MRILAAIIIFLLLLFMFLDDDVKPDIPGKKPQAAADARQ